MQTCPECGAENPDEFRLCGYCGTAFTAPLPPHEVRKTVTVVFSDLRGSTSVGESMDPEALREAMTRYFDEMRRVLEAHGGVVEKYIGDAIMAVFGLPAAHEDDAMRAVRAAVEMQQTLEKLDDELERRWGIRLQQRIGVNTGEVVAGDPAAGQRIVTGDAVNVAARLEQAAPATQILLGERTHRVVRGRVDVEELEPLELKGKRERMRAYRVLAIADRNAATRMRTPLVGRDEDLWRLCGALEGAVASDACALVTVLGDAGVGKSRLLEELAARVSADARVVRGRCLAYGRGITFWPLIDIVRALTASDADDPPAVAREKLAAVALDDDVAERVASAVGLSEREFQVDELFWGVRKLLEQVARTQPLVVVFEDIHWAEMTLLDLIAHVRETAAAPLVLACAARHDLLEHRPGWSDTSDVVLELDPVSDEQSGIIVDNLLAGTQLDDRARRAIIDAAGGNPLFVEQMLGMLIDDGYVRRVDGHWVPVRNLSKLAVPPSIDALLAARLDLLTRDERAVIDPASVIGLGFEEEQLAELVPDAVRPSLRDHLLSLDRKHLVERTGGEFRFRHVLIRDAAYNGLLKRTRASLHERFAEREETRHRERDRALQYLEIVGYHLEQAHHYLAELGPLDNHGRALATRASAHLGSAGRRAFARADMSAAANLLRRAAMLLPLEEPARLRLLPSLGEALMEIGEFPWAILFLDDAVDLTVGDDARLHANAVLTRVLVRHHIATDLQEWSAEAQREAEHAIPLLEREGADDELAKAWRLLGFVHGSVCRFGEAAAAVSRAAEHARRAGDRRLEAITSSSYTIAALYGPTPVLEAIEHCERLVTDGLAVRHAEAQVLSALAQLRAMRGDFERARELQRGARTIFDELGSVVRAAATALHRGRIELLGRDLDSAEHELTRAHATLSRLGERYFLPPLTALLAQVLYARGRLDEALEMTRRAEELAAPDDVSAQALWRSVRAKVLARRGRGADAESLARGAVEVFAGTDAIGIRADALLDLADVLDCCGHAHDATAAASEAKRLYEAKGNVVGAGVAAQRLDALLTV